MSLLSYFALVSRTLTDKLDIPGENAAPRSKLRNICFAWNYLNWGGAQVYFLAAMKAAADDFAVKVVLPRESSPDLIKFIEKTGASCEFINA